MKALFERIGQAEGSSLLDFPIGSIPPYSISAIGGANNQVLALVNGKASWATIEDLTGETDSPSITIPTIQRGDLLSAEDSSTLTTIHAIGGSKFLVTDNANEHSIYRRITAADVDAGTFPGLTYNMGSALTTKTIGFFLNSIATDPTITLRESTGAALLDLFAGFVRTTVTGNINTNLAMRNARGTIAAPLYSTAAFGNAILFQGYDENTSSYASGAYINASPGSTWSATNREMQIIFSTTASGSLIVTNRWMIKGSGILSPVADNSYDIGTSALRIKTGYFGTSIVIGTDTGGSAVGRFGGDVQIGTTTISNVIIQQGANARIRVLTDQSTQIGISLFGVNIDPILGLARASGTIAAQAVPQSGDTLGAVQMYGFTTGGYIHAVALRAIAGSLWISGSNQEAFFVMSTTPSGSIAHVGRWGIQSSGHFVPMNLIGVVTDNTYDIGTAVGRVKTGYFVALVVNESGGQALTMFGAVSDGQYLKRSGTSIIGDTLTVADVGEITGPLVGDFLLMGA